MLEPFPSTQVRLRKTDPAHIQACWITAPFRPAQMEVASHAPSSLLTEPGSFCKTPKMVLLPGYATFIL